MAIILQREIGFKEILDLKKLQEMILEVNKEFFEVSKSINESTTKSSKEKARIRLLRLKEIQKGKHVQLLIKCISLLTNKSKETQQNSFKTLQTFLKNIFGHNNSNESDNNK